MHSGFWKAAGECRDCLCLCFSVPTEEQESVANTCSLQLQEGGWFVPRVNSPTCVKRVGEECKNDFCLCLHLRGEFQLSPACPVCAFRLVSEYSLHVVWALFKLLIFLLGPGVCGTMYEPFKRGDTQFPTSAPVVQVPGVGLPDVGHQTLLLWEKSGTDEIPPYCVSLCGFWQDHVSASATCLGVVFHSLLWRSSSSSF